MAIFHISVSWGEETFAFWGYICRSNYMFRCPKGSIQSVFCHPSFSCLLLLLWLLKQESLLTLMGMGGDAEQWCFWCLIQSPVTLWEGHRDNSSPVGLSQANLPPKKQGKEMQRHSHNTYLAGQILSTVTTFHICNKVSREFSTFNYISLLGYSGLMLLHKTRIWPLL